MEDVPGAVLVCSFTSASLPIWCLTNTKSAMSIAKAISVRSAARKDARDARSVMVTWDESESRSAMKVIPAADGSKLVIEHSILSCRGAQIGNPEPRIDTYQQGAPQVHASRRHRRSASWSCRRCRRRWCSHALNTWISGQCQHAKTWSRTFGTASAIAREVIPAVRPAFWLATINTL
jgi:hypothetical protein